MSAPSGTRRGAMGLLRAGGVLVAGIAVVVVLLMLFANGTTPVGLGPADPGNGQAAAEPPLSCQVVAGGSALPADAHETSGVARGTANPGILWTHNDSGGDPELFGVATDGTLAARVRVEGASLDDWEDIEAGPCADGGGACLYIADTGDNDAERDRITVYQVPEPRAGQTTVPATAHHARYPDGPRDAEGLFLAGGRLHLVTKGREGPIRVYRFPVAIGAVDGAEAATLQPVAELAPRPGDTGDYVTAATASPDGRWVAVRTYRQLFFFEAAPLLAGTPGEVHRFDLAPLGEAQGEGVAIDNEGGVWLTSEAGNGAPATWSRLACQVPAVAAGG